MPEQTLTWLDGEPAQALPLPDRGLAFGDGLFETLLLRRGVPLFADRHLHRLKLGLDALNFPPVLETARRHLEEASQAIAASGWLWAALRVTVTRGSGPRGYAPPPDAQPRVLVEVTEISRDCALMAPAVTLGVADIGLPAQPALAGLKHLNRLEQVLAAEQAQREGFEEMLLLDAMSGAATCVTAGNLFAVIDGQLVTPKLADCGVAGTRRRLVLDRWAPALGFTVPEVRLPPGQLEHASEVFYTNALYGLRPVASLGVVRWAEHPVCTALFEQYLEDLA